MWTWITTIIKSWSVSYTVCLCYITCIWLSTVANSNQPISYLFPCTHECTHMHLVCYQLASRQIHTYAIPWNPLSVSVCLIHTTVVAPNLISESNFGRNIFMELIRNPCSNLNLKKQIRACSQKVLQKSDSNHIFGTLWYCDIQLEQTQTVLYSQQYH